ncbi:MAG: hypothetical protein WBA88_26210 [Pseudaminobacter sp.]
MDILDAVFIRHALMALARAAHPVSGIGQEGYYVVTPLRGIGSVPGTLEDDLLPNGKSVQRHIIIPFAYLLMGSRQHVSAGCKSIDDLERLAAENLWRREQPSGPKEGCESCRRGLSFI